MELGHNKTVDIQQIRWTNIKTILYQLLVFTGVEIAASPCII